jgi:hypothetical protein
VSWFVGVCEVWHIWVNGGIWVNLECDGAVRGREWVIFVGMWEMGVKCGGFG